MNLVDKYLKQHRGEFDVFVNAEIVQAIADGTYFAASTNEYKEWIASMRGRPFIKVMEAMADLVADHMRETYGVPPFMASVSYNESVATVFDDYEKAFRGMKRFRMPAVYRGHAPKKAKSKTLCIGVSRGLPLWFLHEGRINAKKLALAFQYACPSDPMDMLDDWIIASGGTWQDLEGVVRGKTLGVVLKDNKKNRAAVAISGLRYDLAEEPLTDRRYIIATAVPYNHDYDLIADRAMSLANLYPIDSNEEEDEE